MKYVVPVCGLLFVLLAAYLSIAEVRRALVASGGDMKALRPYGSAWLVAFAAACLSSVILKSTASYLVMAGLVLVAWVTIPIAWIISHKLRSEGPMGIGKRGR